MKWYDKIKTALDAEQKIKILGPLPSGAKTAVNRLGEEGYNIEETIAYDPNGMLYTFLAMKGEEDE